MEPAGSATITNDRLPPPARHDIDALANDAVPAYRVAHHNASLHKTTAIPPEGSESTVGGGLKKDQNCKRLRPEEEERQGSRGSVTTMSSTRIGKTVTPFLREHIPSLYAPIGKPNNEETARQKEPNTRYCYRHRPDSKCRRAADEAKMVMIQRELDKLTPDVSSAMMSLSISSLFCLLTIAKDKQAITHVWSLFSAAPARHRELMLQGVLSQLCFPQLSLVSREVSEALKIDFIAALPVELSQKVLCYLDTVSLTKAAQVSRRWRQLADDDAVWVRMCEQHVNRKCTKCGWGLPLLERKRLRNYTRQRQLAKSNPHGRIRELTDSHAATVVKRPHDQVDNTREGKRQKTNGVNCIEGHQKPASEPKTRSWKAVYRDRWQVSVNYNLQHGWRTDVCLGRV